MPLCFKSKTFAGKLEFIKQFLAVSFMAMVFQSCTFNPNPVVSPLNAVLTSFGLGLDTTRPFADTVDISQATPPHLGGYLAWWDADGEKISPNEAYEKYQEGRFKRWRPRRFAQIHNSKPEYWFVFQLNNPTGSTLSASLASYLVSHGKFTAYSQSTNGQWITTDTFSSHIHPSKVHKATPEFVVPLTLDGEQTSSVLLKYEKTIDRNVVLGFILHPHNLLTVNRRSAADHFGFFVIGFLSFSMVLMFVMFLFFREQLYFYQAGYVFFSIWIILDKTKNVYLVQPPFFYETLSYLPPLTLSLFASAFITSIFRVIVKPETFSQSLNRVLTITHKINKILIGYALLGFAVYWSLGWYENDTIKQIISAPLIAFNIIYFWVILIGAIYSLKYLPFKGTVYALGISFAMILWYIQTLNNLGVTNSTFILHNNLFLATIIEIFIYTYFVIDRFVAERREKIKLLQSQLALQQQLTSSVIEAQENERKRIATELHDGLGGFLSSLRLMVNRNKNHAPSADEVERLKEIETKLDVAIRDVREISHNLMPSDFAEKDFAEIIREHIAYLNDNSKIKFEYYIDEKANAIRKDIQISLFRIIAELLNNIQKHSGATVATIQIIVHESDVKLMVEDNGNGFQEGELSKGIGIRSIKSRIDFHKGKLTIDKGKLNTSFIIEIPTKHDHT